MKRFSMLLAAGFAALIVLAGCTSAQQQNIQTLAANAQTQAKNACAVVQPTLIDLAASMPTDANLKLLTTDNAQLCAAVGALDPTSVQNLVDTLIPQAIGLVGVLPVDPTTQVAIRLALGAASIALSNWLVVYGTPVAPVPASGVLVS